MIMREIGYAALPNDQKDSFEHLTAALLARFRPRELERWRFAK